MSGSLLRRTAPVVWTSTCIPTVSKPAATRSFRLLSSSSSSSPPPLNADNSESVRLSKLISQHGTNLSMSRREADRTIRDGGVTIAGQTVRVPHYLINWKDVPSSVKVEGKLLQVSRKPQKTRVWIAHKLYGEVVSERDPQGRPSLVDRLKRAIGTHVKPIGRLDMPTEGLILLTTDGSYAREMELPSNQVHRTYRVRVHGNLTPHKLKAIRGGTTIKNIRYKGMKATLEETRKGPSTNIWMQISCTEGKNRQIRNVLSHLGCKSTK